MLIYGGLGLWGWGLRLGFWGWCLQLIGFGAWGVGPSGTFWVRVIYINIKEQPWEKTGAWNTVPHTSNKLSTHMNSQKPHPTLLISKHLRSCQYSIDSLKLSAHTKRGDNTQNIKKVTNKEKETKELGKRNRKPSFVKILQWNILGTRNSGIKRIAIVHYFRTNLSSEPYAT